MLKATTVQEVVASRRASRVFIFSISAIVIVGLLLASVAFSLFISQQKLTDLTRKHEDIWREIQQNLIYVMGRSEDNPISTETARLTQLATAKLMAKESLLNVKIKKIIADTKIQRDFLGTTRDEENTIINADVDRKVHAKIDQFITATPALVQVGFSFWDTATVVKVHSGLSLQHLVKRANVLRIIQSRNIKVISYILKTVGCLMLLGIWVVWARLLRPNLFNLEKTIYIEREQAKAKELAQEQLAERERELRVILDNTPGLIAGIDNNYRYVTANKAYLEKFELGAEEFILGKHVKDVLGEQQWQVVRPHMEKTFKGMRAAFEIEIPFPTGSRHVQVMYVPENSGEGHIRRFYTLIIDNHERHLAEQALRASEENLYITLDSIGDGVIATDMVGTVTFMNPVAERLTGFKSKEAIKQPLEEILHVVKGETNARVHNPTDRLLRQKKMVGVTDETILISKEGLKHQISDSIAPIKDGSGEIIGMVLTIRDITEEHALRSELNQNRRLQSLGRLAGGISHDFNNLLAAISGAAEIILMNSETRLTEIDRRYINTIIRTTQSATKLTNQLISFSHKSNQTFSPLSINSEIEEVGNILARTIDKSIEVVIKDEASNHKLLGNSGALQNAILNICINAAHAMLDGGTLTFFTSNISLTEFQCNDSNFDLKPGKYIDMRISDTGCGMKSEILDKIFDPYFTTKPMGSGSGIGLASVYGTIVEHSGSITVQSSLEEGSEFRVWLPCTDMEIEKEQSLAVPSPSNSLGTILLVDDDDRVREVVEAMLQQLGARVMTANNGVEGIALYKKHITKINLVIIDMNMPQMNGAQAIAKLKQINSECTFIAITGFSEIQILTQLDDHKIPIILKKPFSFAQLANAVHSIL